MLLIIAHHYVVNSGLRGVLEENPGTIKTIFLWVFGAFGKTGINCFILITGYFMCTSKITARKFFKLLFEVYFYRIIIYTFFCFTGYETVSWMRIVKQFIPFISLSDDFTSCFLAFFLTIPFLTALVQHVDKKTHFRLVALIFVLFVCFASVPVFYVRFSYVAWFIALFLIASYIRLYPLSIYANTKLWGLLSLVFLILDCLSVLFCLKFGWGQYFWIADSNKILAVLTSIVWFIFFKNIKIKQSKIINLFGGATFGVLCIHANSDAMRGWLWRDFLKNAEVYGNGNTIYWHSILSVLGVFIVCAIIDIIRQKTIEMPFLDWFDKLWNKISDKLETIEARILKLK